MKAFIFKISMTHVFLILGRSVDKYSIPGNYWEGMPTLNEFYHWDPSCTTLGSHVYVTNSSVIDRRKIERLNLDTIAKGESRWQLLDLPIK